MNDDWVMTGEPEQRPTSSIQKSLSGRPNVVEILEERGLLESITSGHLRQSCSDPNLPHLKVYCGFDPTAESLHLGNLIGIVVLSWFQRCGHHLVALIGGATARVGDPSGKSLERPELDLDTLSRNTTGVTNTITRILGGISILNNYDWWKEVRLLEFLKDVGRYARVGRMIAKESVKKRLESEQGMSHTEFTYQLLQGHQIHFLSLSRHPSCSPPLPRLCRRGLAAISDKLQPTPAFLY
ncbi:tyrosine--tRNA ligase, chloroplastic/mitochondrial-like [Malus sylvestris]|uniref:tyrosine--tRNA ligase, chloroplastic/mitochondrial-like n=1 Tax=Malus sylvestris TaxID=3752 RepID=UPI0021AC685C|nr:tyrosine--tRNA ligase, chloroplastic/mitochondrial-like [Malus sylvestris]